MSIPSIPSHFVLPGRLRLLNQSAHDLPQAVVQGQPHRFRHRQGVGYRGLGIERIGVVGAEGVVGRRLMRDLGGAGYPCLGFDLGDDLKGLLVCETIVSATGAVGLITPDMVREGVVAIDLGFPKGEFDSAVAEKASFLTPVPGGVGPLTIVCLYQNLAKV